MVASASDITPLVHIATGERALPKQPAGVGRGARGCFAVMELPVCSWASA